MTTVAQQVYGLLQAVARQRATITYGEVAEILGLNLGLSKYRAEMGDILREVAEASYAEYRVVLTAIVVGGMDGMPSGRQDPSNPSGFYAWMQSEGFDISNPHKLVAAQQAKVYRKLARHRGGLRVTV